MKKFLNRIFDKIQLALNGGQSIAPNETTWR